MFTKVKTEREIEDMRESGRILASVLDLLFSTLEPGMNGNDVEALAVRELKGLGVKPAFLGQYGCPSCSLISVNDAVVHGLPDTRPFERGDLISIDFGVIYNGMISDSARSVLLGGGSDEAERLLKATEASMYAGIDTLKDGVRVGDIGAAVERVLKRGGYGIVRDMVGHGVGHQVHEDPNIPNYGQTGTGPALRAGMTVAIEPMATLGGDGVFIDEDGWTVRTLDGSLAAHFEHTVLITQDGYEILTLSAA